jgi:ATP-dependent DNA helicase RecQ
MLWTEKASKILKKYFGYTELKEKQYSVINELLSGNDVIGLLPTGYGKSMCYILPPLVTKKTMVIISPLISLMEDQKDKLNKIGIQVSALNSNNTNKHEEIEQILDGDIKIIYMSPEYLIEGDGLNIVEKLIESKQLGFLAVDESHCLSSWGHDFRPNYLKLAEFRDLYPQIPILAVTATAKQQVITDIEKFLKLNNPEIIRANFDRPNLFLDIKELPEVPENTKPRFKKDTKYNMKANLIKHWINTYPNERIIVYVNSRDDSDNISEALNKIIPNCSESYHAGLSKKQREIVHSQFADATTKIIIATIAFGMGIDQVVKCVIIFGCPSSIEEYYQEIGRAGRDELDAHTVLYYDKNAASRTYFVIKHEKEKNIKEKDKSKQKINENKIENLNTVKKYVDFKLCRRQFILEYFESGKKKNYFEYNGFNCSKCDNCLKKNLVDITKYMFDFCINKKYNKIASNAINDNDYKLKPIITDWEKHINSKKYTLESIPDELRIKLPDIIIDSNNETTDIYDKYKNIKL